MHAYVYVINRGISVAGVVLGIAEILFGSVGDIPRGVESQNPVAVETKVSTGERSARPRRNPDVGKITSR